MALIPISSKPRDQRHWIDRRDEDISLREPLITDCNECTMQNAEPIRLDLNSSRTSTLAVEDSLQHSSVQTKK